VDTLLRNRLVHYAVITGPRLQDAHTIRSLLVGGVEECVCVCACVLACMFKPHRRLEKRKVMYGTYSENAVSVRMSISVEYLTIRRCTTNLRL
jgi:hypothetical protein